VSTGPGAERFDERRLLVALFGAGTAAFAQLYAPQSVLPDAARDLATSASATALLVSARSQAAAVYNLAYYAGSSVFGWLGGVGFALAGWPGTVGMVLALVAVAVGPAAAVLRE
jgi:hypothetical protein